MSFAPGDRGSKEEGIVEGLTVKNHRDFSGWVLDTFSLFLTQKPEESLQNVSSCHYLVFISSMASNLTYNKILNPSLP